MLLKGGVTEREVSLMSGQEVKDSLVRLGHKVLELDISKSDLCSTPIDNIDIIFNCAGDFGGSFEEQEVENIDFNKFQKVLMVNAISILNIIKIILNKKKNKSKLELIINISGMAGSIYHNRDGNAYIYRTSKSALNSITKNLSIDLNKKFGTTVFAIHPDNTKSGMNPGGYIETDNCAKLIIDLITTKSELNGKFVNLLGKEIFW